MAKNLHEGKLGMRDCIAILVGGMIGSAIYSLSGLTMFIAGPALIITWVVAALILLMYGLMVAELSVRFPRSGGVFVFPAKSLGKTEKQGRIWGWFSAWGFLNANVVAIAFSAIYVGTYLEVSFPIFKGMQIPLALASILIVLILNLLKITITGAANTVLVGALILTMLIYAGTAFFSGSWEAANFVPFFTQGAQGATGFISAIPNAMVAYGSVVAIAFMVGEVKNPKRNVPKSVLVSMIVVVSLYLLCIVATLGLITTQFLIENAGMRFIPFYAAAFTKLKHIVWLPKLISISAVLALLTTKLVVMAITSRSVAAIAEDGLLPKIFAQKNKNGISISATLVVAVFAMVVSCFPQFTSTIVNLASLFSAITIVISCLSLIVARKKFADQEISFKAPGGVFLPYIAIILIVASYIPGILKGTWQLWAYTFGWYAIGALILAYGLSREKQHS